MPLPAHASASRARLGCAPDATLRRRSRVLWQPNDAATGAWAGRRQDPNALPSVRCSCVRPEGAVLCSSFSKAPAGLGAPRLAPGLPCTPRSTSLVGLARRAVVPRNNSTTECYLCDPVVVGNARRLISLFRPELSP